MLYLVLIKGAEYQMVWSWPKSRPKVAVTGNCRKRNAIGLE
ncbi:hypothetical protein [Rahnella sikkimica]|nr:hypothetical protein [Rahnella sikkimica]